ncbi:MAG: class I SAM-dependent methyltransferase [Alphaproteobacteria bacterium]|nr:class I SAM-dependent methyltransferase [Alphaproteobacteria bacterium]
MDELALLSDLHRDGPRQGPGSDEETRLAITLSGLRGSSDLRIADIGCGSGASTRVLARELDATITAVDFLPEFLQRLDADAQQEGLDGCIETLAASMDSLPFDARSLDAIWSEGAIYNIGFEAGIRAWRRFLKPGGIIAVSELTWLTHARPEALERHWVREYPEVDTVSAKMAVLERHGFSPVGYFALPERCWLENYYHPLQSRFETFLSRHGHSAAALAVVESEEEEIALYEGHSTHFGYGFYIARKTGD